MNAEQAALFSWTFEPVPAFGLLVTALVYFRGWRKLNRQVPLRFPFWRLGSFLGGLAAIYVSLASPLDAFASFLLTAHMVQHLLLTMLAPPLLLLGAPQLPLLAGLPRSWASRGLGPFLNWPLLQAVVHRVTHPAVCWVLFILSNLIWHFPGLYDLALRSPFWHQVEHLCFLATALLFWWHVVQPWPSRPRWPRWAMIPYLLLADLQNTVLAGFLSFYDRVLYATYETAPRLGRMSALEDQNGAGAVMWVPGSIAFLIPAAVIAIQFLSPRPRPRPQPPRPARSGAESGARRRSFDLFHVPVLGSVLRWKPFRRVAQSVLFGLAVVVVVDGILGPQISPINLAGVLPWTHWRAFTVVALLVAGNLFCMACPFTFVRDLGRRFLPAGAHWPRVLRTKWIAVGLIVGYLWAYEAFDLWDNPAATAWVIVGYFLAALLVDGFFRNASFCKYLCPIGQFHFVQSLASPFEIKTRDPAVCVTCRTHDCIRGNETQRGCELRLFQPRKQGNMDCTFCLDCVQACPHDNVGWIAVAPGRDLTSDPPRSSVGRYAARPDLAALVLVLTFGAFANAAGMVQPVLAWLSAVSPSGDLGLVTLLSLLALVVAPAVGAGAAAAWSRAAGGGTWKEHLCRFALALAPLGFGMWLAHFLFHFFTGALTPLPVFQRAAREAGLGAAEPNWGVPSWAFNDLPGLELLLLDAGLLLTLWATWRIAEQIAPAKSFRVFLPWALLATLLFAAGVWIIFQPMEMRGTLH